MFLLCVREQPEMDIEDTVYVWKSPDFDPEDIEPDQFIKQVIQQYWGPDVK